MVPCPLHVIPQRPSNQPRMCLPVPPPQSPICKFPGDDRSKRNMFPSGELRLPMNQLFRGQRTQIPTRPTLGISPAPTGPNTICARLMDPIPPVNTCSKTTTWTHSPLIIPQPLSRRRATQTTCQMHINMRFQTTFSSPTRKACPSPMPAAIHRTPPPGGHIPASCCHRLATMLLGAQQR